MQESLHKKYDGFPWGYFWHASDWEATNFALFVVPVK